MKKIILISTVMVFLSMYLYSHELWIDKKNMSYSVLYGHKGHEDSKGNILSYELKNILEVRCYNNQGKTVAAPVGKKTPVTLRGNCAAVTAGFTSGYWTKTIRGTKNIPKNKAEGAIYSWYSVENSKFFNTWNNSMKKPLTSSLEIIPINNPLKRSKGDKIRLLITFNGSPVKNAAVAYDDETRGSTDDDGRINIRIRHRGFQIISVSYKIKNSSPKADFTVYTAHFNFEVK